MKAVTILSKSRTSSDSMKIRRLIVVLVLTSGAAWAAGLVAEHRAAPTSRSVNHSSQGHSLTVKPVLSFEERLAIMCKEGGINCLPTQILMQPQGRSLVREWAAADLNGFVRYVNSQENGNTMLLIRGGFLLDMLIGVKNGQGVGGGPPTCGYASLQTWLRRF